MTAHLCNARHALFKYSTSFSLWSTFLLILSLISYPDLTLSYAVRDLVTRLPLSLLTRSLNYLLILFDLSQWELHCSCVKPLVLSNVVQGESLSASFQDYYCCPKNPALIGKIMWSSELQSVTLLKFASVLPTLSVLYVTNKDYICMVN